MEEAELDPDSSAPTSLLTGILYVFYVIAEQNYTEKSLRTESKMKPMNCVSSQHNHRNYSKGLYSSVI